MAYPGSGSGNTQTADERRAEANRVLEIVKSSIDAMTVKEADFVTDMLESDAPISPKQLWWLRDIKAKYCE